MRYLHNEGDGYVSVPGILLDKNPDGEYLDRYGERFNLTNWTIEATVRLTAVPKENIILLSRKVEPNGYLNYELGIDTDRIPYVRFHSDTGAEYKVVGYAPVPLNEWTHIGGRYGAGDDGNKDQELTLFINGAPIKRDVTDAFCVNGVTYDDIVMAANLIGDIDDVRLWKYPVPAYRIAKSWDKMLLLGADSADMGSLQANNAARAVQFEDDPALHLNQWTIEAWINTKAASGVIVRRDGTYDDNYKIQLKDGRISAVYGVYSNRGNINYSGGVYGNTEIAGATLVNDGKWHHIAFTLDGFQAVLYVDGVVEKAAPYPSKSITWADQEEHEVSGIDMGVGPVCIGESYSGLIDEVRIFNRGRSSDEIKEYIYNQIDPNSDAGKGLLLYLTMDDVDLSRVDILLENSGSLQGTARVIKPAEVQIENFIRASEGLEIACNAPISFNTLAVLGSKLAAYFPFDDGRLLANNGELAVEDFKHRFQGCTATDGVFNEKFAGTLVNCDPEFVNGGIDFVTYYGFTIADCSDPMLFPTNLSVCAPSSPFRSFPLPEGCPWITDSDGDGMA